MAISRASRAWSGRPSSVNVRVEPVRRRDQLGRGGAPAAASARSWTSSPSAVARWLSRGRSRATAAWLTVWASSGLSASRATSARISSASARNWTSSVRARAAQASTRDRSASLTSPALSSTRARSMPTTPRSKSELASSTDRHQLQRPRQVAGQELEQPEVVRWRRRPASRQPVTPGPARSARAQSALAAAISPEQAVHLAPVEQDLALVDSGGASSSDVDRHGRAAARASVSRPSRSNIAPRWAWISTRSVGVPASAASALGVVQRLRAAAAVARARGGRTPG